MKCPCCRSEVPDAMFATRPVPKFSPVQQTILNAVRDAPGYVSMDELIHKIYNNKNTPADTSNAVRVQVNELNKRLEKYQMGVKVRGTWGLGYRIVQDAP